MQQIYLELVFDLDLRLHIPLALRILFRGELVELIKKALSLSGIRHSELCVDEDCKDQPHFSNASLRGLI